LINFQAEHLGEIERGGEERGGEEREREKREREGAGE
jgi:hypothetical protein